MTTKKETKGRYSTPEVTVKEEKKVEELNELIYDLDNNSSVFSKLYDYTGNTIDEIKGNIGWYLEKVYEEIEEIQYSFLKKGVLILNPEQETLKRVIKSRAEDIKFMIRNGQNKDYIENKKLDLYLTGIRYTCSFVDGNKMKFPTPNLSKMFGRIKEV